MAEFKPETPKIHKYPYYCPICFRYFNSKNIYRKRSVFKRFVSLEMLMTVCCKNYICELCSKDIEESTKQLQQLFLKLMILENQNLNSKCLYCNAAQITLKKVEPDDIVKKNIQKINKLTQK